MEIGTMHLVGGSQSDISISMQISHQPPSEIYSLVNFFLSFLPDSNKMRMDLQCSFQNFSYGIPP